MSKHMEKRNPRILVACGGTSGHINPALAIAEEIRRRRPGTEFLFVGTKNHLEAELVPRAGFPIRFIEVSGLSRKKTSASLLHNLETGARFLRARREVRHMIREFRPDLMIGTGGYVSAPVLSAALSMHVRTLIHEQNAFAGVTTKLYAARVDRVLLSFPLAKPLKVPENQTVLVGDPVQREFGSMTRAQAREALRIASDETMVLSYGGSLGAKKLNEIFCEMVRLSVRDGLITHYHAAGGGYDFTMEALGEDAHCPKIHILPYVYNMPQMMAAADLVIARSGAGTVTELQAAGRASILIPSPNVTENHQFYNAKTLSDIGASVLLEEKDTDGARLYEEIQKIVFDQTRKTGMEQKAASAFRADTLDLIYREVEALLPQT